MIFTVPTGTFFSLHYSKKKKKLKLKEARKQAQHHIVRGIFNYFKNSPSLQTWKNYLSRCEPFVFCPHRDLTASYSILSMGNILWQESKVGRCRKEEQKNRCSLLPSLHANLSSGGTFVIMEWKRKTESTQFKNKNESVGGKKGGKELRPVNLSSFLLGLQILVLA